MSFCHFFLENDKIRSTTAYAVVRRNNVIYVKLFFS
nr:MAG TPA: hypothetical protein [Caudoviricetes sp.]